MIVYIYINCSKVAFFAGLKMLVGSFSKLFGTKDGRRLQAWCKKEGWVLAWGLGAVGVNDTDPNNHNHGDGQDTSAPYANRSLDLEVLPHTTAMHNMSVSPQDKASFAKLWDEVFRAVNATAHPPPMPPTPPPMPHPGPHHNHSNHSSHGGGNHTKPPNPFPPHPGQPGQLTNGKWMEFWRKLPAAGKLGFLGGASCADVDSCVGVLEGA